MPHSRVLIRDAAYQMLLNTTSVGSNVFRNRVRPIFQGELPAIIIYTREETAEIFDESPRRLKRNLQLVFEIETKADNTLDDKLDFIAGEIEAKVNNNQTLGGVLSDIILKSTRMQLLAEGDDLHGACELTFDCEYFTDEVFTGTLDDFVTADITYDLNPADPYLNGEDRVTLPIV